MLAIKVAQSMYQQPWMFSVNFLLDLVMFTVTIYINTCQPLCTLKLLSNVFDANIKTDV